MTDLAKIKYNLRIAIEAIFQNRIRALLTSLGIVFGVASVISMLAVGSGAQQEILEQMKLLGTNNIIIKPIIEQEEGKVDEDGEAEEKQRFSPGLTMADAKSIREIIPAIEYTSPEIVQETIAIQSGLRRSIKLVGVTPAYFTASEFDVAAGNFIAQQHIDNSAPVCVIGAGVKTKFFPQSDPIGNKIKCGKLWLTVIGVLEERRISEQSIEHLGIRDYNLDVYTPLTTMLLRYKNRALVTGEDIKAANRRNNDDDDDLIVAAHNYHQLDRLVVRVKDSNQINQVAEVLGRMMERRHHNVVDFEIVVPELLLAQEQRTRTIFNIVLGAIASISLIVGGIGIMNIMLASVMERIREIGIRLAVGATPTDIVLQFISEAVSISLTGGIAGILLGILISYIIETSTGILTIVSPLSVFISFLVAVSVGLIFGIVPARRAAAQDPVVSLRYE